MVFCAFKVYTLFSLKQLIKFISSSNHYTLKTWPRGINATWITLSLLLDTSLQNTIIAILLAHKHLIWVALPLPPIQCCFQTVKAPIRKEIGQIVLSNIEWGKGGVWADDFWQWLWVVWKPVNSNPGLKVNQIITVSPIAILFCSFCFVYRFCDD